MDREHNHHQTGHQTGQFEHDNPVFAAGFEKGYDAAKTLAEALILSKEAQIAGLQMEVAALRGQAQ
jgi:hypothetical protein